LRFCYVLHQFQQSKPQHQAALTNRPHVMAFNCQHLGFNSFAALLGRQMSKVISNSILPTLALRLE
jgi:hypothetical protein